MSFSQQNKRLNEEPDNLSFQDAFQPYYIRSFYHHILFYSSLFHLRFPKVPRHIHMTVGLEGHALSL